MSFQWDSLLLEAGVLGHIPYRWIEDSGLALPLVGLSLPVHGGLSVKLLSGDPTWHDLTALEYHFWSQPLPTPLAWYAAQLPSWLLIAGNSRHFSRRNWAVWFLIFLPRRIRAMAACCVLLFQLFILLTGNYNFFNLLTMLLCLFSFR